MKSKTLLMRTASGKPVYSNGAGSWSLDPSKGWKQADVMLVASSPGNMDYQIRKASAQVGEPCEWIPGPVAEYMNP